MKEYNRITKKDEQYGNYVQNEIGTVAISGYGKIHGTVIDYLAELEDKIENGTLIELNAVAKLFNRLWECPCDYIFDNKDVNEFICENVEEDWCEKNCPINWSDYSKCWEVYLKAKLKELENED